MSESLRNGRGIWNVRAMPLRQMRCAESPAISLPLKRIEPAVGRKVPAIRLNVVLLPEPFGPIRPRISPSRTANDTWLTARKPPKRLVSPSTASMSRTQSAAHGVDRRGRQRQHRLLGLDVARPDHGDML